MSDRMVLFLYVLSFALGGLLISWVSRRLGFKKETRRPPLWMLLPGLVLVLGLFISYELHLGDLSRLEGAPTWQLVVSLLAILAVMVLVTGLLIKSVVLPVLRLVIRLYNKLVAALYE